MSSRSSRGATRPRPQRMPADSFQFIDQSSGTITREQRQAIRSTVMIRIRNEEERAGIKRSGSRRPSPPTSQRSSGGQTSPEDGEKFDEMIQELHSFRLPNTPSLLRENPFDEAMESESSTVKTAAELMGFCFRTFLPSMFPAFGKNDEGNEKRQRSILSSKSNRLATFFGVLSIAAAHQTMLADSDLDLNPLTHGSDDRALTSKFSSMNLMKHHGLSSITQMIQQMITSNQNLDEHVLEAVFLLIGAALAIGNFREASLHFTHMESSMRQAANFDHTSVSNSPWIPLFDLAYAATHYRRPLFDLPWDEETVHEYLEGRVPPLPSEHKLALMGRGFAAAVPDPSDELKTIILQGRQIVLLCEFGIAFDRLSSSEHEQLYRKILHLQYDVVIYLAEDQDSSSSISAVDRVICLAILALISTTMIRVVPSSGQGRQMTLLHHAAVLRWLETWSRSQGELKLLLWALLLFRQCSGDEEKSEFFEELLRKVVGTLKVEPWTQTEDVLYQFLYVPSAQEDDLQQIFEEAFED